MNCWKTWSHSTSVYAEALDEFFKTESRVRTDEAALWREITRVELGFAEEFGLLGEVEIPDSALGRLRLHGLVFVGETVTYGRTAMIPKELRAPLGEILGVD